jgi:hypothetical protein
LTPLQSAEPVHKQQFVIDKCPGDELEQEVLRALQAPLKSRYKEDAGAALVTLTATGDLSEGITCSVDTGRALVAAGLHPATGGDGLE